MKDILLGVLLLLPVSRTFSQGTVVFANTPTTLVSAGPAGQNAIISKPPGSYYFGLLTAPPGTTDTSRFVFAGAYATNSAVPGYFAAAPSGYSTAVPGWGEALTMSFLVAGWSSSLGHDWNQQWMSGDFGTIGCFGLSSIGTGETGGPAGGVPAAALPLFGPTGSTLITTGWNLDAVPEPSAAALLALGTAALLLRR
jgi:hypothetical protein